MVEPVPASQNETAPRRAAQGFRLPGARDRISVVGRTGSGKTHFAGWVLSRANWPSRPWILIDYKRDDLLADIPAEEIAIDRRLPRRPGLYIIHPRPDQDEAIEKLLWRVWSRGRTGLFVDEAHMLPAPHGGGLEALLTQGRSKHIPVVALSQRPSWINRFLFSEADYYSVFHLNDRRDRATVGQFLPGDIDTPLERHHSRYYDVGRDRLYHVLPAPQWDRVLDTFDDRDPRRHRRGWRML